MIKKQKTFYNLLVVKANLCVSSGKRIKNKFIAENIEILKKIIFLFLHRIFLENMSAVSKSQKPARLIKILTKNNKFSQNFHFFLHKII